MLEAYRLKKVSCSVKALNSMPRNSTQSRIRRASDGKQTRHQKAPFYPPSDAERRGKVWDVPFGGPLSPLS